MKPSAYGPFDYVPLPERPRLEWPDGARLALWIAPNIDSIRRPATLHLNVQSHWIPDVRPVR